MENRFPKRKHPRMDHFDYSTAGAYFITICTQNKRCLLSHIVGQEFAPAEIRYTRYGQIVQEQLLLLEERYPSLTVDQYVIMPNHIHILLFVRNDGSREFALRTRDVDPYKTDFGGVAFCIDIQEVL